MLCRAQQFAKVCDPPLRKFSREHPPTLRTMKVIVTSDGCSFLASTLVSIAFAICLIIVPAKPSLGQISFGGKPYSFDHPVQRDISTVLLPTIDRLALMAEDESDRRIPRPARYGVGEDVSLGIHNSGLWEVLENGDRLWRLRIQTPNALGQNLLFTSFFIPPGGRLFLYDDQRKHVLGAFNHKNYSETETSISSEQDFRVAYISSKCGQAENSARSDV